jgi:hypothetical protein
MAVSANVGKLLGTDFPFLTYSCSLSGQVANFQNLLIAIGNRYPSSRATLFSISPAQLEGELDLASLVISIYCDKDN